MIAAQNNVVITGNICYAVWITSGACNTTPPALNASSTDVLGLIAYNYAVSTTRMASSGRSGSWNNDSTCPSNEATMGVDYVQRGPAMRSGQRSDRCGPPRSKQSVLREQSGSGQRSRQRVRERVDQ